MGLDSVELVVSFEDFFNLQIPDNEVVEMGTIRLATDYISSQINYINNGIDIKNVVFEKLNNGFEATGIKNGLKDISKNISEIIPLKDGQKWKELIQSIDLNLPNPALPTGRFDKFINKLFPAVTPEEISLERYLDLICAVNYHSLVAKNSIQNKYEVLICVMGITEEKMGCDIFEIFPNSRFVKDLGIN